MSKHAKILIAMTSVALLAVIYLIVSAKPFPGPESPGLAPADDQEKTEPETVTVDPAVLENEYITDAKPIIEELEHAATIALEQKTATGTASTSEEADLTEPVLPAITDMESLRDRLISLTVPSRFRTLHLDMILALDKMLEFASRDNTQDLLATIDLINQAKIEHEWLN